MRLISEYEPVRRLCLSFVHEFFNERFGYGKVICDVIKAAEPVVEVEVFVSRSDLPNLEEEFAREGINPSRVFLNFDSPGRGILTEYAPIYAEDDQGKTVALVFNNPLMEDPQELRAFSERWSRREAIGTVALVFPFATAGLAVNNDVVLLSKTWFEGADGQARLEYFRHSFPDQSFHVVPSLEGDVTNDLDMFLWPIAPRLWIVSEYPAGSLQAASVEPALEVLRAHNHTIERVPGLEQIRYDDINTMPNYANGVILNRVALVPVYGRREDEVVVAVLKRHGFDVAPIDCRTLILSNSALHCISRTVPLALRGL